MTREDLVRTHGLMLLSRKICQLTAKSLKDDATDWFSATNHEAGGIDQSMDTSSFMLRCMKRSVCKFLDLDSESAYFSACVFTRAIDDLP